MGVSVGGGSGVTVGVWVLVEVGVKDGRIVAVKLGAAVAVSGRTTGASFGTRMNARVMIPTTMTAPTPNNHILPFALWSDGDNVAVSVS
jgi:hypothetical protein